MSDVLHDVLTKLGAMGEGITNLVKRSDEDRQDAGRHRHDLRGEIRDLRDEVRSMNDWRAKVNPVIEYLDKQSHRRKIVREWIPRFGNAAWYLLSMFAAAVVSWFGVFEKVKQFFVAAVR